MSGTGAIGGANPHPTPAQQRAQVRVLAHQLEGVFLNQLFQAMRESVPQDGVVGNAPGQQMFTQMLDERVSEQAAKHMTRGLGEALYRQLAARLPAVPDTEAK